MLTVYNNNNRRKSPFHVFLSSSHHPHVLERRQQDEGGFSSFTSPSTPNNMFPAPVLASVKPSSHLTHGKTFP